MTFDRHWLTPIFIHNRTRYTHTHTKKRRMNIVPIKLRFDYLIGPDENISSAIVFTNYSIGPLNH